MKEIKLTQGKIALVDKEDFEYLNQWKWNARKAKTTFYGKRTIYNKKDRSYSTIYLHREVMRLQLQNNELVVDHKNHNGLDNRKENLRVCTLAENGKNCIRYKPFEKRARKHSSIYFGVHYDKQKKKFRASIQIEGKKKQLGSFKNEEEAALSYNKAAREHFGEDTLLNKIKDRSSQVA